MATFTLLLPTILLTIGGTIGGTIRGTTTAVNEVAGFKSVQRTFATNQKTDPNWMSGTLEDNMDELFNYKEDSKPVKNEPPPESPEYGSPEYYNSGAGAPNVDSIPVIESVSGVIWFGVIEPDRPCGPI